MGQWIEKYLRGNTSRVIISIVVIAAAVVLLTFLQKAFHKARDIHKSEEGSRRQGTFLSVGFSIIRIVVVVLAIVVVLEINGVRVTSLITGLGIASAVAGFAFQDMIRDIIMGAQITSDRFFEVGDVVRYGDFEGVVTDFNLRTTKLRSIDDRAVLSISNRNISEITKLSEEVHLFIPLAYTEATDISLEVLEQACRKVEEIKGISRCINLGLNEFGASSVEWKLRIYCPPEQKPDLRRKAQLCVYETLTRAGIRIPFGQLDVHVKS